MPKKHSPLNLKKQPLPTMSSVLVHPESSSIQAPLSGDDDDDDICPVCESECTCSNRAVPVATKSLLPSHNSTSTSTPSSQPPLSAPSSLKIKLTVPPKPRLGLEGTSKAPAYSHHVIARSSHSLVHEDAEEGSLPMTRHLALSILDPSAPKRRGRPSKATIAAREAARAALAGGASTSKYTHTPHHALSHPQKLSSTGGKSTAKSRAALAFKRKQKIADKRVLKTQNPSHASMDSGDEANFPTFMLAASTFSHSSSSESSDYDSLTPLESSDSEMEAEEQLMVLSDQNKARVKKDILSHDSTLRRREYGSGSRWEIKPRKKSVGPDELGVEPESGELSGEDVADDEDNGESDVDDGEADTEGEDLTEMDDEQDVPDADGKLGVSFGGVATGWSEDEESSFDADIFFANLDDSSDSCSSPIALRHELLADSDSVVSFSSEEDAFLSMDVEPSRHDAHTDADLSLGGFSFGWDGQLLLPPNGNGFNMLNFDLGLGVSTETDTDMAASDITSENEDLTKTSDPEYIMLEETDAETTEDELVDSDGLPNPRAMMLFQWPSAVSAINPLSTMSSASPSRPSVPPNASRTLHIALASIPEQRGFHTPTPADILAGRISMDDLDDIETARHAGSSSPDTVRHVHGKPVMGQFITPIASTGRHAIIDGQGAAAPTPYPRSRVLRTKRKKVESTNHITDTDSLLVQSGYDSILPLLYTPSDENSADSHAQSSEDPSSTDAIDLDDVLDSSFLEYEALGYDGENSSLTPCMTPRTPAGGVHLKSLDRWDRIPVAAFRHTRETIALDSTPVSDGGLSNRMTNISAFNHDMLGTPKGKSKTDINKRLSRSKIAEALALSPLLLPVHDGDRTPTLGESASHSVPTPDHGKQQNKSRKELRREKAMTKRKMVGKYSPQRQSRYHHRHHYPNSKMRGSNSMQRTNFFGSSSSSVPHLTL